MMIIKYDFPLEQEQCGAMLGNGVTGEMIWGKDNVLNITLGCGSLWDHRGGMPWTEKQNFHDIREALYDGDLERMTGMFERKNIRPSLIPVGRVEITLPANALLLRYEQELVSGRTSIIYDLGGREKYLVFYADFSMQDAFACSGIDDSMQIKVLNSYDLSLANDHKWLVSEHSHLKEHGLDAPESFAGNNVRGFVQPMPADPAFAMICRTFDNGTLTVSFRRGIDCIEAADTEMNSFDRIAASSAEYFSEFWKDVPVIKRPDSDFEKIYYHGLFKYAIMTNPAGVPAGLQGPWIEDDRMPPWQGDYHFNINVQMCYSPGYKAGKFANLKRLFDMVISWKPKMRHNARCFCNIDNGYMMPHSMDDRMVCMGGFWTGAIDHASTAWVAMMMFDYCEYSGNNTFLKDEVYDFMSGALRVYEAMMETDENGNLSLPVTVSPEYRDANIDAWGQNSSFQLGAVQQLAKNMLKAAAILGIEPDAGALKIREKLPLFTNESDEIAMWEGLLLECSHRHHSHLAGITPFGVIDPLAPEMEKIIANTLYRLTIRGMGEWVGWCMPWASQIYTHCCNGDMAELILKIWNDGFTNAGGGSLHDGRYKGFTVYAQFRGEVMQMDGGMGAVTAIQDQFMHIFDDELRLFCGIPKRIRNVSFENMFAPNGMKVSGKIDPKGKISAEVKAAKDGVLKISVRGGKVFTRNISARETIKLIAADDNSLTVC